MAASTKQQLAICFFNETVLQFIEDLQLLYKKDTILAIAQGGVKLYLKSGTNGLHKAFEKCFGPYYEEIKVRDEGFFLDHTTAEYKEDYKRMKSEAEIMKDIDQIKEQYCCDGDVGNVATASVTATSLCGVAPQRKSHTKSVFDGIITKLKGEWGDMAESNKKIIWDYVNQLVVLSERARAAAV
jgi:uncharacterized protein YqkB